MTPSQKKGDETEAKFLQLCEAKGWETKKPTETQNIKEHWDLQVTRNIPLTGSSLIDIKAAKKINRNDEDVSYDWTWVEIRNVNGDDGWLKGKADYIAFEQKDHFIIARREELREWCKKKIDLDLENIVSTAKEAEYKLYTREKWGKKDLISLINLNDLKRDVKCWELKES
tara:strand:- start:1551 stop:2063 length:513 start_codon:yes stop_codon:yes gene_type:complete